MWDICDNTQAESECTRKYKVRKGMSNYEEFDKIAGDIKKGRLVERQITTYLGLIAMYLAKITDVLEAENRSKQKASDKNEGM